MLRSLPRLQAQRNSRRTRRCHNSGTNRRIPMLNGSVHRSGRGTGVRDWDPVLPWVGYVLDFQKSGYWLAFHHPSIIRFPFTLICEWNFWPHNLPHSLLYKTSYATKATRTSLLHQLLLKLIGIIWCVASIRHTQNMISKEIRGTGRQIITDVCTNLDCLQFIRIRSIKSSSS